MFKQGNASSWMYAIQTSLPAFNQTIIQIHSVIEQSIRELVGMDTEVIPLQGDIQLAQPNLLMPPIGARVQFTYQVPMFKMPNATEEAVEHDTMALSAAVCKALPNIASEDCITISVQRGEVIFKPTTQIPIGMFR